MFAAAAPIARSPDRPIAMASALSALATIGVVDPEAVLAELHACSIPDQRILDVLKLAGRHTKRVTHAFPEQRDKYIAAIMPDLKTCANDLARTSRKKTEDEILDLLIDVAKVGDRLPPAACRRPLTPPCACVQTKCFARAVALLVEFEEIDIEDESEYGIMRILQALRPKHWADKWGFEGVVGNDIVYDGQSLTNMAKCLAVDFMVSTRAGACGCLRVLAGACGCLRVHSLTPPHLQRRTGGVLTGRSENDRLRILSEVYEEGLQDDGDGEDSEEGEDGRTGVTVSALAVSGCCARAHSRMLCVACRAAPPPSARHRSRRRQHPG